jgi:hypothetical protein
MADRLPTSLSLNDHSGFFPNPSLETETQLPHPPSWLELERLAINEIHRRRGNQGCPPPFGEGTLAADCARWILKVGTRKARIACLPWRDALKSIPSCSLSIDSTSQVPMPLAPGNPANQRRGGCPVTCPTLWTTSGNGLGPITARADATPFMPALHQNSPVKPVVRSMDVFIVLSSWARSAPRNFRRRMHAFIQKLSAASPSLDSS